MEETIKMLHRYFNNTHYLKHTLFIRLKTDTYFFLIK
jgi:hypothetical protein